MGVQILIVCSVTIYSTTLSNTATTAPPTHPPPHQYQQQYNPRQPNPVELGEDHRFPSGGEVGLQLEGGDPDHLPRGKETLVTPRPEPANPLAAIEQAVGEQRDQRVAALALSCR